MPTSSLIAESLRVIEGTSIYSFPNSSTDSFGTIDVNLGDVEAVNALNVKYPRAWTAMYNITLPPYTYTAVNAARLKKAVEFWLWLASGNSGYVNYEGDDSDEYFDNLVPVNVVNVEQQERIPYSSYTNGEPGNILTGDVGIDRIPPFNQWNSPIYRTDVVDAYITYSQNTTNPTFLDVFLRRANDNVIIETKVAESFPILIKFTQKPVYAAFDEAARLIRWVYDNRVDTYNRPLPNYVPFVLNGSKLMATGVVGSTVQDAFTGPRYVTDSHAEKLWTADYLTLNEYQTTHRSPKTPWEWGGEFATGKNTF